MDILSFGIYCSWISDYMIAEKSPDKLAVYRQTVLSNIKTGIHRGIFKIFPYIPAETYYEINFYQLRRMNDWVYLKLKPNEGGSNQYSVEKITMIISHLK